MLATIFRKGIRRIPTISMLRKSLSIPNAYFHSRSSKAIKKSHQDEHWHILNTESIVKDLEIIYHQEQKLSDKQQNELRSQSQSNVIVKKQQIVNNFEQFKLFFTQKKQQIQKMLSQINLTSDEILQSLQNVSQSLELFCGQTGKLPIHELFAKSSILNFIAKQIFQKKQDSSLFKKLAYILETQIKLKSIFTYFDLFSTYQPNITNSHPSLYPEVWKHIQIQTFDDHQKIAKNYRQIEEVLHATHGAIQKSSRYGNSLLEKIFFGINLPINYIKYEWGLLNSLMFYRSINIDSYKKFLNLYEDGVFRLLTEHLYFPKIQTNIEIFIPPDREFDENLDIFKPNKDHILVRILYHKDLPLIKKGKKSDSTEELQNIIVHMHGGGFIGLSSHTTQNYTRPWANELKMPLFSIDYRMPPTHPFPHAPNDCLQVYKFLTNHLHRYMRIRPKNIYVCGDSAGGNLSLALTALVMKNGLIKPKGLFLAYPCTDVRMIYYPSRKFIINDPILWPSITEMFFSSYTRDESQRTDPIASPVLLSEQSIGGVVGDKRFPLNWPLTYITVGSKDILRDECLLLMQKMVESNVPCKCFIFEHLSHAFFSTQKMMKQSDEAFQHSIGAFKEMVERSKKEHL